MGWTGRVLENLPETWTQMQDHCPCRGQVHQVAPLPAEAETPCLGSLLQSLATGLPKQGLDLPLCDSPLLQVSVPGLALASVGATLDPAGLSLLERKSQVPNLLISS